MAGQAGAARAHSRCQQVVNASFRGQVRLIFSTGARMADQPGGQAQEPVARCVRFGVLEIFLVGVTALRSGTPVLSGGAARLPGSRSGTRQRKMMR